MQLTPEQQAILQTNTHLVINAVAGSGKTTTLIAYAKSRPANAKILYLAFNKTVKTEAIEKFAAAGCTHVKVETAHSLAFDYVVKRSNYKVVAGYSSYEWCQLLGIASGDRHADFIIASHVNKFISFFCNSRAGKVQEQDYAATITDAKARVFVKNFYAVIEGFTRAALAKMDKAEIAVTHDFYLKKFQLSHPTLGYDYILFDEGQDASAAMLDVFLQQTAIKIIVGDAQQQIYGWRYAINSLQQVDFPVYQLSSSFRFNDEIALVANKILGWKKHLQQPPAVKIIGAGNPSATSITKATLGRTNLGLLLNAITQWQHGQIKNVYFEGNINSYTFADEGASLYDVLNLHNGKTDKIKDRLIAEMKDMKELQDYIDKTEDKSLGMIVDVVKEFGNRLPELIKELKTNHAASKQEADMIFSTVHRCKGMEYDEVTLLTDFIQEEKLLKYIAQLGAEKINEADKNRLAEEINILYVAATRAKRILKIPLEINPLTSLQVISQAPAPALQKRYSSKFRAMDDWDVYSAAEQKKTGIASKTSKTSNHGKKWSLEDEADLQTLFNDGTAMKEIAKQLGRGVNGIRYKLHEMGLLEEGEYLE
jgi:F-box protein, helicase, 18